jgi:V/A-type H+/Na+-transporting ATPase subunit E
MEEIVSADAIRREILEDARKKAAHLLEEGEAEAARNVAEIEAKAAEVVEEIFQTNAAKSARYRMETMARFPLERTRMRTTFVDGKLREAVAAYMAKLTEARVVSLSEAMLAEGAEFFAGKALELRRKGIAERIAREVSSRALGKAASVSHVEDQSLPAPGFVASALDGSVRLRATMDLVEDRLLDEKRGELALSLCAEALSIGEGGGVEAEAGGRAS